MKTITFEQFISEVVVREKVYNTVETYNVQVSSDLLKSEDLKFRRQAVLLGDLREETLRKQYIESVGLLTLSGDKFDRDEMFEVAKRCVEENFGKADVLIYLGDDLFMVADVDFHTVRLMVSENTGAIILLNPRKHMLIKLTGHL